MSNLFSVIFVAVLGVVGNIAYFEYRLKKEHKKKLVKERLIKLLLPLYILLKTDELEYLEWQKSDDADVYEYESGKPDRLLKPAKDILDKNLYLADDDLQLSSLSFIEWVYREDSDKRFQKLHYEALEQDEILENFRAMVYQKYDEQRKKYTE